MVHRRGRPCRSDGSGKVAFTQQTLANLWVVFSASADYLFNASHSFAYGYLAFVTAYLKANWPSQYGAALLANVPSTARGKRLAMMASLREEGVAVLAGRRRVPRADLRRPSRSGAGRADRGRRRR